MGCPSRNPEHRYDPAFRRKPQYEEMKELEQWKGQKSIYYQPQAEIGRIPVF